MSHIYQCSIWLFLRVSRNTIFVKKIKIICILYSCLKSDSMFDFKRLFDSSSKLSSTKFYKDTFDHWKSTFIQRISDVIEQHKKQHVVGKEPLIWSKSSSVCFFMADNGMKMSYIKDQFGIAKSTYYYYFNLIAKYKY